MTRRAICVALALGSAATGAEAPVPDYGSADRDRWRCRLCPFEAAAYRGGGWRAGVVSVDEAHPRFGRDNGLDRAGERAAVDLTYDRRGETGTAWSLEGRGLGLDSRQVRLRFSDPGRQLATLEWREIPRNVAADGRTPYMGRSTLTLPRDWIAAASTADMPRLASASRAVDHATHRRRLAASWQFVPAPRWGLRSEYRRERRQGTGETWGDFLYQSAGLPLPVDHDTEEVRAGATFTAAAVLLDAELAASSFDNGAPSLEWENPYGGSTATGRRALEPDNRARSLSLAGRWLAGRTVVHGRFQRTRMSQNAPFLPYATRPGVAGPVPARGLAGRVDASHAMLRVVSRLTQRLRLDASHRHRQRDNRTPALVLTPVLADAFAAAPRRARGYDVGSRTSRLRLQYRTGARTHLRAGLARGRVARTGQEIARNDEDGAWIEWSTRGAGGLRASVRLGRAHRDASPFRDVTVNNPDMRRFHQAERRRRSGRVRLDRGVGPLALGAFVEWRRSEYPGSALGLLDSEEKGWGVDVNLAAAAGITLGGHFVRQTADSASAGSAAFAAADWWSATQDAVDAAAVRVDAPDLLHGRLALSASLTRSDGVAHYVTRQAAGASEFPALTSEIEGIDLRARYSLGRRTTLVLRHYAERYASADWALAGVGQDAIRNVLALGRQAPRYSNRLLSVSVEVGL